MITHNKDGSITFTPDENSKRHAKEFYDEYILPYMPEIEDEIRALWHE